LLAQLENRIIGAGIAAAIFTAINTPLLIISYSLGKNYDEE
jgi:hypothetical protein